MTTIPTEKILVDAIEAAEMLGGISTRHLHARTKAGEIPHVRVGHRVLYSPRSLAEYVKRIETGGNQGEQPGGGQQ